MPEKKREQDADLLGYPRCALNYASISSAVFDTLIERGASRHAVNLCLYLHFNLSVWNGKTHARSRADIARDLKISTRTVTRAISELTDLGIIDDVEDGYGARYHIPQFVEMRDEAARKQRERAEDAVKSAMENWIANFKRKRGRAPTARERYGEEAKMRRDRGLD